MQHLNHRCVVAIDRIPEAPHSTYRVLAWSGAKLRGWDCPPQTQPHYISQRGPPARIDLEPGVETANLISKWDQKVWFANSQLNLETSPSQSSPWVVSMVQTNTAHSTRWAELHTPWHGTLLQAGCGVVTNCCQLKNMFLQITCWWWWWGGRE